MAMKHDEKMKTMRGAFLIFHSNRQWTLHFMHTLIRARLLTGVGKATYGRPTNHQLRQGFNRARKLVSHKVSTRRSRHPERQCQNFTNNDNDDDNDDNG